MNFQVFFLFRWFRVFIRSVAYKKYTMAEDKKIFKRLPKTVKPVMYDLYLKPDLQKFTFEGKETVSINVSITILQLITTYILHLICVNTEYIYYVFNMFNLIVFISLLYLMAILIIFLFN